MKGKTESRFWTGHGVLKSLCNCNAYERGLLDDEDRWLDRGGRGGRWRWRHGLGELYQSLALKSSFEYMRASPALDSSLFHCAYISHNVRSSLSVSVTDSNEKMARNSFKSILYSTSADGKVATITLNRPKQFNAIDTTLPGELRAAVKLANANANVHCIVVKGNGPGFCGGYDLKLTAENAERGVTEESQDLSKGYDLFEDYQMMKEYTECYAELFHSYKPTIA
jgi:hypothetical protein